MTIPDVPPVRATLHAGGRRSEYLVAGRGSAVLLLHPDPGGEPARSLLRSLAADHRVVAPLGFPGCCTSLDELFEGLGIERAVLVIEATVAAAGLAFAAGHHERVDHIAIVGTAADGGVVSRSDAERLRLGADAGTGRDHP